MALQLVAALNARLPLPIAIVWVGPPLFASAPSPGSPVANVPVQSTFCSTREFVKTADAVAVLSQSIPTGEFARMLRLIAAEPLLICIAPPELPPTPLEVLPDRVENSMVTVAPPP